MKLTIEKAALVALVSKLTGAVEKRNTIPILSHIALYAEGDKLVGRATNLDLEVATSVQANIDAPGETTVPAATLATVASKMPSGALITMQIDRGIMKVSSGKTKFDMPTLPVDDFPAMDNSQYDAHFTMPSFELHRVLDLAKSCQSTEETRYYLNGVYMHNVQGRLRGVSTDGHRLAQIDGPETPDFAGVIVPSKTVAEVLKLLDAGDANVSISQTKIKVAVGDTTIVSKVVDGTFPDYTRVIPNGNDNHVTAPAEVIKGATDRVASVADNRMNGVRVHVDGVAMRFSVQTATGTAGEDEIEVDHDGAAIDIVFNSKYLAEVLTNCKGQDVRLEFGGTSAPVLIRPVDDDKALYVVMPMRV